MTDAASQADPEPETPDYEQYTIYARREIIGVVEDIIKRKALVTVHFAQGEESFVTTLLHVNPEFEELVIDQAPSAALTEQLLRSGHMTFVTYVDQIKVQFSAQRAEPTSYAGRPALRIRLPDTLLRLQRRNYYRVPAGKSTPLICEIPLPDGRTMRFAVGDISLGGVAVIAGPALAEFAAGMVIENCRIELPGHGSFTSALEIRNNQGLAADARNPGRHRYGCQFLNLGGPVVSLIQRYINQLERSRRSLV
jgi:c-di-GMP-binding flagellar brake protein YcgR